jgi:hypothetical protein
MARIAIKGDNLVVNMKGLRRLGTYKSVCTIPLSTIKNVTINPKGWAEKPNITTSRWGIGWLGFYMGGSYWEQGGTVFCDLKRNEAAIVIDCATEDFVKLVIGVNNPEEMLKLIEAAL